MVLVKFCCVDGALVEVDSVILEGFKTIKNMFEFSIEDQVESLSCCTSGGDVIPLANVESKVFRLAIEWATKHYLHYKEEAVGQTTDKKTRNIELEDWDSTFISSLDKNTFTKLILAANYLENKELLDLCCNFVANQLKGKSVAEMREILNVTPTD